MSIDYIVLLVGQSLGMDKDGTTWQEVRSYESGDVELVNDELPSIGDPHPSISDIYLKTTQAVSMDETHERVRVTLNYGPSDSSSQNQRQAQNQYGEIWEWTMTAQQVHITSAPEGDDYGPVQEWNQVDYPARENHPAETTNRIIGAKGDGEIEGTDVYRGTGALRVTKEYSSKSYIDSTLRKKFYKLQAHTNQAAWKDWDERELLYLGARIRFGAVTGTVEHNFLFGEVGATDVRIAPSTYDEDLLSFSISDIKPFQYLWQEPMERMVFPQGLGGPSHKQTCPRNAKLAIVYPKGDFNELGLEGP